MAHATLPDRYDKNAATEDWRTGVVELPADHVYGATALTAEEWERLTAKFAEQHFFLVDSQWPKVSPALSYAEAQSYFDDDAHGRGASFLLPGVYAPDTGRTLHVVSEDTLRMVVKEAER